MHARTQIRDAIITAVTGLSLTASRIFAGRIYPLQEAELPGICVYTNAESSERVSRTSMRHTLDVALEIYVKGTGDFEKILDDIAAATQIAIAANTPLNSLVKDIYVRDMQKDLVKDGEKPIGICVLTMECTYHTQQNNPTIIT